MLPKRGEVLEATLEEAATTATTAARGSKSGRAATTATTAAKIATHESSTILADVEVEVFVVSLGSRRAVAHGFRLEDKATT